MSLGITRTASIFLNGTSLIRPRRRRHPIRRIWRRADARIAPAASRQQDRTPLQKTKHRWKMKWRQPYISEVRECRHGLAFSITNGNERELSKNNSRDCKTDFPAELRSIAYAIERLGCRMGEDPERAMLRKEALADRVRAVATQIGGAA